MSRQDPEFIECEGRDAESIAAEQFVHGVLETVRCDSESSRRHRMMRVIRVTKMKAGSSPMHRRRLDAQFASVLLAIAAALIVISTLLLKGRETAADLVGSLSTVQSDRVKFEYVAVGSKKSVYGELDVGQANERLMSVVESSASIDSLLLRRADGACLFRNRGQSEFAVSWPQWLCINGLAVTTRTPQDWLTALHDSHVFELPEALDADYSKVRLVVPQPIKRLLEGKQCRSIVGVRRAEIIDPLIPQIIRIWIADGSQEILAAFLTWPSQAVAPRHFGRSLEESIRWFKDADHDHDGKVSRAEAGSKWSLFSTFGFDHQTVSMEQFIQAMHPDSPGSQSLVELLADRPDLDTYELPMRMTLIRKDIQEQPVWLFAREVFQHR